jgi:glutaredoxin-like protein DUF836
MADVLVVTSPACHLCEDALAVLAELGEEFPLAVREVELGSDEGRALFERYHPSLPPFVIIDGALFSSGRLPGKKLRKHLERTPVVA